VSANSYDSARIGKVMCAICREFSACPVRVSQSPDRTDHVCRDCWDTILSHAKSFIDRIVARAWVDAEP